MVALLPGVVAAERDPEVRVADLEGVVAGGGPRDARGDGMGGALFTLRGAVLVPIVSPDSDRP